MKTGWISSPKCVLTTGRGPVSLRAESVDAAAIAHAVNEAVRSKPWKTVRSKTVIVIPALLVLLVLYLVTLAIPLALQTWQGRGWFRQRDD